MASPCFTVPLPGGRPWPSGRMSMSQPAISSGLASRPMPSGFDAEACFAVGAFCATAIIPALATTPARTLAASVASLADFDILDLAVLVQLPRLDAVVVVDRVDAAEFPQLRLARLDVAAFVG